MSTQSSGYGQTAISSLKNEEQVRKRPAVIFGTNDEYGAANAIFEIIANSIDEARAGEGKQIRVGMWNNGDILVEDDGRGVPMEWNPEEKKMNWELVFCTLYASGKYNDSNYSESLGLNGLGATATQYASEYMHVESTYGGKTHIMDFEKGVPKGGLKTIPANREGTGTLIRFRMDKEVFISTGTSRMMSEHFIAKLMRQAMLHDGIEILYFHEAIGHPVKLFYESGMADFVTAAVERPMLRNTLMFRNSYTGSDHEDGSNPYTVKMRMALNFSPDTSLIEMYHNGSHLYEGDKSLKHLGAGIREAFDAAMKEKGKLSNSDKSLTFGDIESLMIMVSDTNSPGHLTFWKNQTKAAINNPFILSKFGEFVYENVYDWLRTDPVAERVMVAVLNNKTAREEASKVSRRVIQSLNRDIKGVGNYPEKFSDCETNDVSRRELYIVEGDSAKGACILSRDADFQAIQPVRGKIINCLKQPLASILNSQIIIDLIKILGCGIEVRDKYIKDLPPFNINKLKWNKVIICTDADIDGMQIRCLIITMIYRLMPSILKSGKVFIAETPLYEIGYKGKTGFAYTDEEKNSMVSRIKAMGGTDGQIHISRSKGLGENEPEMMSLTTMNPKTRKLTKVEYPENDSQVHSLFQVLMGDDLEGRREIISAYFNKVEAAD